MSVELPLQRFTDLEQPTLTIRNPADSIRIRGSRTSDVGVRGKQRVLRSSRHVIPSMLNCYREGNTITITINRQWENEMMDKGSVDLDIVIPVTSGLHLNGSAGSINLTGVADQIAIEANAGSIYAQKITFRIRKGNTNV